jgi:hypothetical protein
MQTKKVITLGLTLALVFSAGVVIGAQPHMQNALSALQTASNQLQQADNNKGGHRARAISLINQATAEVQAGINFASGH